MSPDSRIVRLSNTMKGLEERLLRQAHAAIVRARRTLSEQPCPDTFLGRKTQEPFPQELPKEDDDV
jgi:hypothetical protein